MILKNARIILEDSIIAKGWMEVSGTKIKRIEAGETELAGTDLMGKTIMPGFIDCHVHGGYGVDFEVATFEAFNKFAKMIAHEGVTKFCQATVTQPSDVVSNALKVYAKWMSEENNGQQARQIGAHIEGPFISEMRKGAHKVELLKRPDCKLLEQWIKDSNDNIRVMTYATEEENGDFTKDLIKHKILPSVGHTNATFKEFSEIGYRYGARHVTHLFNGMSGVDQHNPGVAAAALYYSDVLCELISDGIHVKEPMIKLIYKIKGANGICLITDAMCAKGMPDGPYKLGPLDVDKKGQTVCLKGTDKLAGSAATYDFCFRQFRKFTGAGYVEMAKMCAGNVARQLGIWAQTGSIVVGKLADLTVLDGNDEIAMTICEGEIAFSK